MANGIPSAKLMRALRLSEMTASGCHFLLNDLSPEDWIILEALREGREQAAKDAKDDEN